MFSCAQLAGGCIRAPPSERSTHAAHAKVSLKLNLVEEEVEMEDKRPPASLPPRKRAGSRASFFDFDFDLVFDLRFAIFSFRFVSKLRSWQPKTKAKMKDKIDNRMYNKTNIDVSKMTIDKQKERKCAIEQSVACFDWYFPKFFNYANLGAASSGWPHVNHQVAKSFLVARYLNVFVAVSVTRTVSVAVSVSVSTTQFA